jgi:Pvc16 N-terminal domain
MSNALAIAAVTETLVQTLEANLVNASKVQNAWVSSVTPDQKDKLPDAGVNIFLYQITPNAAFRNADLPTRSADGTLLQRPQVALDLHYLFTFYGDERALEPQRLLGAVTLALHANPVLARNVIQLAPLVSPSQQGGVPSSALDSGLNVQSQLIRLTPVSFTIEELSKIWSFLLKVDYVLSAAYVASVVLIQTHDPQPPPAPPALSYRLAAAPFMLPVISQVAASPNPAAPIIDQSAITVIGANLSAPSTGTTQVLINTVPTPASLVTPNRIVLTLPAQLKAGIQTVQIIQPMLLGSPPTPHPGAGAMSGVFPFMLVPAVAPSSPPGQFAVRYLPSFGSPPGPVIQVGVVPVVKAGQRVLLLLSQTNPVRTRLVDGGALQADSATLIFPAAGIGTGNYFVQVLVDGAQSALALGPGGVPVGPTVVVPP